MDPAVLNKLEKCWSSLCSSDSNSLLKKYLTKEVFDKLKNKKTSTGSTLLDCVQSGMDGLGRKDAGKFSGFQNHDSEVGIYAPDAEAYTVFAQIFHPIMEDYHMGFKCSDKHPAKNWGDVNGFDDLDPECKYVISTRVQCGRSLDCFPFSPTLSEKQYTEIECQVSAALEEFTCGELKGEYYPLTGMCTHVKQKLTEDNILFDEGDRFLQAANGTRFWPTGRGIFHNKNKTFIVWCNEEDHLALISTQKGGNLKEVYKRLVTAVNEVEKKLSFLHHDRLGFLTCCPTNLGTAICASVHIQLPKLACKKCKLEDIAGRYNLKVKDIDAAKGVFDISNKRRLGLTEYAAVKEMSDGIKELICVEDQL